MTLGVLSETTEMRTGCEEPGVGLSSLGRSRAASGSYRSAEEEKRWCSWKKKSSGASV